MKWAEYFDGTNGAVTGSITASIGLALGTLVDAVTHLENVWVWGFSLGFGVGMLIYAVISVQFNNKETE